MLELPAPLKLFSDPSLCMRQNRLS
nr:hypothetical protein BOSE7B_60683 [Bosea sp. 7B]